MEVIESLENKKVKYWKKLNIKKYQYEEQKFLVEGEHLVGEALKNGALVEVIKTLDYDFKEDIDTYIVTYDVLKKIANTVTPQKILGVCKMSQKKDISNKILILDNLQDPGNFGTIIRSCVAFNIQTIVVSKDNVSLYNDKVIRASEGMLFNVNVIECDLEDFINDIKSKDYKIYGTHVANGKDIADVKLNDKFALIMGNEGAGVRDELLKMCDEYLYIGMNNKCESLNVGVATSILLYEIDKRG